jgi:two-component system, cell cycle sensor histidine kinase and response regulator CckA
VTKPAPPEIELLREQVATLRAEVDRLHREGQRRAEPHADRETWLEGLLALSPDVISVVDRALAIRYVSQTFHAARSDVIGSSIFDFTPREHHATLEAAFARVLSTGEAQQIELRSQSDVWWETRIAPLRRGASIEGFLTVGRDATAKKRAERELALRDEQLRLALEATEMGLWRWDVARDEVTWDAATRKLFGWPLDADGITYADYLDRVHPEDRERVEAHVADALATGRYPDLECRIVTLDGTERWVLCKGRIVGSGARPEGLLGGIADVTQTRRRDANLRSAQKLEAIGQLAGGIAHDFNNILVAIMGNLDLLRLEPGSADRDELLHDALGASRRAADLTRQLLTFGRKNQIHETSLDVGAVTRDTLGLLRRLFPETIRVDLLLSDDVPKVRADRGQLEQVLMNLCVNARDAMPHGGVLGLTVEAVTVDAATLEPSPWAAPGPYVRIRVSDTGTGMPRAVADRIFEPFFTTKEQGTGLGLATAYAVVKRHGGHLSVESAEGRGSRFEVLLPIFEGSAEAAAPVPAQVIAGGRETILVAEDETAVRAIVCRVLTHAGYRVLAAEDGRAAVRLFREHAGEIQLLLFDAVMPGLGGPEAVAEIRSLQASVPAIVSSGYSSALADGPAGPGVTLLPKPYDPATLLTTVRTVLDGHRRRSTGTFAAVRGVPGPTKASR